MSKPDPVLIEALSRGVVERNEQGDLVVKSWTALEALRAEMARKAAAEAKELGKQPVSVEKKLHTRAD
jgi:RNA-binding protein YlmH